MSNLKLFIDAIRAEDLPGSTNDQMMTYLGSLDYTGALPDRMFSYFEDLEYTGAMDDKLAQWVADGATLA